MHIFLSKKVAMPNGVKPQCLSFNPDHGWLACGGSDGLLKVLKLDAQPSEDSAVRGVAATTTLSMNQTLEGHRSAVAVAAWNPHFRKLTTADESGLIIVWVLHKGMWIEDMINNRNKSTVADMKWGADGTEICIAYKDGAVIVGSVDGNRIWSREMGAQLALVEWSPDGQLLLFCDVDGAVSVHNRQGVRLGAVPLPAVAGLAAPQTVASLEWYDGLEGARGASCSVAVCVACQPPGARAAVCIHDRRLLIVVYKRHPSLLWRSASASAACGLWQAEKYLTKPFHRRVHGFIRTMHAISCGQPSYITRTRLG